MSRAGIATADLLTVRTPAVNFHVLRDGAGLHLLDAGFVGGESFLMEARQPLAASIDTACCRAMDVVFDSRDPQSESVLLELVLLDTSAPEPLRRSLGAASLQPSFSGEGSVRFEIASAGEIQSFNEILVRFHLEQPRQLHSARVAIQRFDLVP